MKKSGYLAILTFLVAISGFVSCSNDPKIVEKEVEKVVEVEVEKIVEVDKKADEIAPSNVTYLTATAKDERVLLTWIDAVDEDIYGYEVTYNGTSAINRVVLPALDSKTMMVGKSVGGCYVSGLTNGTSYTFTVKTVDTSGNKSEGVTASATPITIATGQTMQIALTSSVPHENGYTGTKTNTKVIVTAKITTVSNVSRVVWKKNGSVNAKILLADTDSTEAIETDDNSTWNFDIEAEDESANGIYTVAAIDTAGREESEQIIIDQFDFTAPAQIELKSAVYNNSSFVLDWIEPNDTDYDHVEITYTTNNGISDSNISDAVNVAKGTTTKIFTGIDSTKSYYTYSFVTVDSLGNRGPVCNYRVSIKGIISESGVDFDDYATNYAICVKNNSTKNLVLFKGEPTLKNVIGGVKACSTSHIKRDGNLFSTTQNFVVYVVTEDDYIANKDSDIGLQTLTSAPYTTFSAVYKTYNQNEKVYEISSHLGGKYKFIVNNSSEYNVELRNDYLNGESLGFVENMSFNKVFHLEPGEYSIFPVLTKFDKSFGEIISVYPTYASGNNAGTPRGLYFSLDNETTAFEMNVNNMIKESKLTQSAAYIRISNNADRSCRFYIDQTSTALITSTGEKIINSGKSLTYTIDMERTSTNKIGESIVAAGYRLGTVMIDDIYLHGDATTTQEYKAGYLYSYTVVGSPEYGYTVTPLMEEVGSTVTIVDEPAYIDNEGNEHETVTHTETLTTRVIKATPIEW